MNNNLEESTDRRDAALPGYSALEALAECYDVWASGCWSDSNAQYDLAEVMGHVERLLEKK